MKKKYIILSVVSLIVSLCFLGIRLYRKWVINQPVVVSSSEEMVYDDIYYKILDLTITDTYYDRTANEGYKFYIVTMQITNNSEYDYSTFTDDDWQLIAIDPSKNNTIFTDNTVVAIPELPENDFTLHPGESYKDELAFQLPIEIEKMQLSFYENGYLSDGYDFVFEFE